MKKNLFVLLAIVFFASCGNSGTTTSETDTGSVPGAGTPAVENVNGNVPDTTNSVQLNKPLPTDTLAKDSVRGPDSARKAPRG